MTEEHTVASDPAGTRDDLVGPDFDHAEDAPPALDSVETAMVEGLRAEWQDLETTDLHLRYRVGVRINGLKAERAALVSARLAVLLKIATSELSRMCKFARSFSSWEDFTAKNPGVTTWSKVRDLLDRQGKASGRKGSAKAAAGERKTESGFLEGAGLIKTNLAAIDHFSPEALKEVDILYKEVMGAVARRRQQLMQTLSDVAT